MPYNFSDFQNFHSLLPENNPEVQGWSQVQQPQQVTTAMSPQPISLAHRQEVPLLKRAMLPTSPATRHGATCRNSTLCIQSWKPKTISTTMGNAIPPARSQALANVRTFKSRWKGHLSHWVTEDVKSQAEGDCRAKVHPRASCTYLVVRSHI